MPHKHKISLWSAILININVMFGTGIFINTVVLSQKAGILGCVGYLLIALLALPLVITMAKLVERHPGGGFYAYASKELSPFFGFLSAWSYFFGKLASGALMVHAFGMIVKQIVPQLAWIPWLAFDGTLIALMTGANLLNMKTGKKITYAFIALKVIPALFVILSGLYLYQYWSLPPNIMLWEGIPSTLPLILFAFSGFEVACSISRSIENAHINGPKAILYSYAMTVALSSFYQLMFFMGTNGGLMFANNFLDAYPLLIQNLFGYTAQHVVNILHAAAAASALGGSYGIMFSNQWNLYEMAQNKHIFGWKFFTPFNKHDIPYICVFAETLTYLMYLITTGAQIVPLQQVASLGVSITYLLSVIAFLAIPNNNSRWIGICATGSCLFFIATTVNNFMTNGFGAFFVFAVMVLIGCAMFWGTRRVYSTNES
jgi:amino acid transporter